MEHAMKETRALWMGLLHKKEEWKFVSVVYGEVFAALAGMQLMPMLYAGSLALVELVSEPPFESTTTM